MKDMNAEPKNCGDNVSTVLDHKSENPKESAIGGLLGL